MGEVKSLILMFEHDAANEFTVSPIEKVAALWKADRKIKIVGSILQIHVSTSPIIKCSAQAEITLEPRITIDIYTPGEKSEVARVINFFLFYEDTAVQTGFNAPTPNVVMFPQGQYITVEKDSTIHLIDEGSIVGMTGTTWAIVYYIEG